VWPIALHVVDIAFKKPFVVAFRLSLLFSLIFSKSLVEHGGQDDSILSAKLIRVAPETSSF
jgi:hypothetical protein